jgi:DNA phosphorothioation-associated putative methyltransferase
MLNIIEDVDERTAALREAWELCQKVLVVAARILVGGWGKAEVANGDGILTQIGTFQKFYTQTELREYLETTLGTDALPAAPGVFYVFRDETLRQQFLANRYRRRSAAPKRRIAEVRFDAHRDILEPLIEWIGQQGRLPEPDEFAGAGPVIAEFGSLKRAFALIQKVSSSEEWELIRKRRTEDLLVSLALGKFRRRPPLKACPLDLQRDIRAFFGNYHRACEQADELLFRAGQVEAIDEACQRSPIGKLLPNALYVHRSALDELEPLLRVYEGCASAYLGEIEEANLIKLHRFSGKVSYLSYPDFDTDPHPALFRCIKLSMRTLNVDCYDYAQSTNPPILHRKETFLASDHPLRDKFAKLTKQEEQHGLLDETATIGTREGWQTRLAETGYRLAGHRLLKRG